MKVRELVTAAMFVALITVTTAFVKIPLALTGYIHLGDTFIFLACYFLRPRWAIPVSALGSALADVIAFPVYAPATFLIKAGMAAIFALFVYRKPVLWREIVGVVCAGLFMLLGYLLFEGFFILETWEAALANIALSAIQPAACGVLGVAVLQIVNRIPSVRDRRF